MINVKSIVKFCDTADDGQRVFSAIKTALDTKSSVTISFRGCPSTSSSFVNVAFVQLLNDMSFDDIKKRIKLIDCTSQIGNMIKTRLAKEATNFIPA